MVSNINTWHVSAYVRDDWLPHCQQTDWFTNCHRAWRQRCSGEADRFVLIILRIHTAELSFPSFCLNLQWRDERLPACVSLTMQKITASVMLLFPSAASGTQALIHITITAALLSHSARKPRNDGQSSCDGRGAESPQRGYCSFNSRVATLMHKSRLSRHYNHFTSRHSWQEATFPTADQDKQLSLPVSARPPQQPDVRGHISSCS